jgi:hypothetical protein
MAHDTTEPTPRLPIMRAVFFSRSLRTLVAELK